MDHDQVLNRAVVFKAFIQLHMNVVEVAYICRPYVSLRGTFHHLVIYHLHNLGNTTVNKEHHFKTFGNTVTVLLQALRVRRENYKAYFVSSVLSKKGLSQKELCLA
jgi:hypothetical protein